MNATELSNIANRLQSFWDRLANDPVAGTKFEGDSVALEDAIVKLRHIAAAERAVSPAESVPDLSKLKAAFDMWKKSDPEDFDADTEFRAKMESLLAQPLQQEGGKDEQTLFEKWYRSKADSYPDAHAGWMARAALKQVGAEEIGTVILCEDYGRTIKWKGEMPRVGTKLYTTPQPSDNLQQASTAQEVDRDAVLESAVQAVADRVGAADRIMAVNAYDAIRSLKSNRFAPHESAAQAEPWADFEVEPTGDAHYDAGNFLLNAAQEFWNACRHAGQYGAVQWLTGENGELLIYTRGEYRETLMRNIEKIPGQEVKHFAQATPEGADLPPLPLGIGAVMYFTVDQMRDYARAALVAQQNSASNSSNNSVTTASEPVPQYRPKRPAGSPWHDVPKGEYPCVPADLYEVRTLYRAAPPQQVEPECCNHDCNQGRDCPNRKR